MSITTKLVRAAEHAIKLYSSVDATFTRMKLVIELSRRDSPKWHMRLAFDHVNRLSKTMFLALFCSLYFLHPLLTSCLPFTLRSATVRDSGYISEKVFSVASAVTYVSGELKSAGNVLTGGQRVC
jgi:hypothetical protein